MVPKLTIGQQKEILIHTRVRKGRNRPITINTDGRKNEGKGRVLADSDEDIVFHGTHGTPMEQRTPDTQLKSYDSLGLWLTGKREAAKFFGPKVYEYKDPVLSVSLWDSQEDEFRKVFYNHEISEKINGTKLSRYLKLYSDAEEKVSGISKLISNERSQDAYYRTMDKLGVKDQAIYNVFSKYIYRNPKYLAAFRSKLESQGKEGIFWPLSSIDVSKGGIKSLHDVYLVFDPAKLERLD
jgi:hypothetical protein